MKCCLAPLCTNDDQSYRPPAVIGGRKRPFWFLLGQQKEQKKLTNVARASLEELKIDYEDFLRTRGLALWTKDNPLYKRITALSRTPDANYITFKNAIEHEQPEICANAMASLTNITSYLLYKQIRNLEEAFIKNGGLREMMWKARKSRK